MSKTNGEAQLKSLFERSPELRKQFYDSLYGEDGKSGIIKEPYAHKFLDLIPDGVKILDCIQYKKYTKKKRIDK